MLNIIYDGDGQMCNKLLFCAQVVGSAYNHNFMVKYYSFPLYDAIEYQGNEIDKLVIKEYQPYKYRVIINVMTRIWKKITKRNLPYIFRINSKEEAKILESYLEKGSFSKKNYFWYGWPYMDYVSLRNNVSILRNYFRFKSEIIETAKQKLGETKNIKIYGIHMRRGDYKAWHGGKYYFNDDVYIRLAKEIVEISVNQKVRIVLFSNEAIDENKWKISEAEIVISNNPPMLDLCMMSLCDVILGPPSSFSGWASFIGNKKRFLIDNANKKFDLEECYVWLTETDGWGTAVHN